MKDKRAVLFTLFGLLAFAPVHAEEQRPNNIVILADDLGNADLGYRGSQIRTPNIDARAKGGVRLESYYGLPLCTPAHTADLFPSWNNGKAKQSVIEFVAKVTKEGGPDNVPPVERIAVFDNDGPPWREQQGFLLS